MYVRKNLAGLHTLRISVRNELFTSLGRYMCVYYWTKAVLLTFAEMITDDMNCLKER